MVLSAGLCEALEEDRFKCVGVCVGVCVRERASVCIRVCDLIGSCGGILETTSHTVYKVVQHVLV